MRAVLKKASCGTRRVFSGTRCSKQASTVRKRYSVHKTGFCGTRRIFKGALNGILSHRTHLQRPAEQPTPQTVDSLLPNRTHFQRRAVPKAAPAHRTHLQRRETAPALFVRSGPFHHFLRPANAELVSGGPFPCSFDGTRYRKRPPTVPNMRAVLKKASSGTRRVFRSAPYQKTPSTVRKRYSVHKTGFCGTRRTFKGALNGILSHRTHLQRPAEQPTPQTVDSPLPDRTHFRGAPCQKQHLPTGRIFRGGRAKSSPLPHWTHLQRRETAPTLFVRSGPFLHFLRPANAELVSGGPFPCSFNGTRHQKRPPLKDAQNGLRSEVSRHKKGAPRKERTSIKLYDLIISPEIWRPAQLQDVR